MTTDTWQTNKKIHRSMVKSMKESPPAIYIREMLGKTISKVVLRERRKKNPRCQLFLEFSDGTYFEFYVGEEMIKPQKGLMPCKIRELQWKNREK